AAGGRRRARGPVTPGRPAASREHAPDDPAAGRDGAHDEEGEMFNTFSRSWDMVKASAAVLRSDRELMLFPVLSGLATLLVVATFALPAFALKLFSGGVG